MPAGASSGCLQGTERRGLVGYRSGSRRLSSGLLRFAPGARVELHLHKLEEQDTVVEAPGSAG